MSANIDQEWEDFKNKFGKKYSGEEEETMRRDIFIKSKAKIDEHNKRHVAGEVTYSMGINAFSDNTDEEHALRCGKGGSKR